MHSPEILCANIRLRQHSHSTQAWNSHIQWHITLPNVSADGKTAAQMSGKRNEKTDGTFTYSQLLWGDLLFKSTTAIAITF